MLPSHCRCPAIHATSFLPTLVPRLQPSARGGGGCGGGLAVPAPEPPCPQAASLPPGRKPCDLQQLSRGCQGDAGDT